MTDERSNYSRIAFHSPATLDLIDQYLEVVVLDLSLKGTLICLPADTTLEVGTICILHVQLNETELKD